MLSTIVATIVAPIVSTTVSRTVARNKAGAFISARAATLLLVLIGASLVSGCGSTTSLRFPGVYRIDIAQGNIITQKQVDQLRPGLNKRQVTFILGTPLVRDTFSQSRWDYVYGFQHGGGERVQERLTVFFKDDKLDHIEGDFQQTPENLQFPATSAAKPATPAPAASTKTQ